MQDYSYVKENFTALSDEIRSYGQKYGREITLVSVTKSGTDDELLALCGFGATDIGENRPQELVRRGELIKNGGFDVRLHEIGSLQRNKVKYIIQDVALIHSLDSLPLAEEIEKQATKAGRTVPVLIEINSGREENKGGVMPEEVEQFAKEISRFEHLVLSGLMTMGPVCEDAEGSRQYFRLTKNLFDDLLDKGYFKENAILSMGMSDSYRVAIEEGSTLVRVGRMLFRK